MITSKQQGNISIIIVVLLLLVVGEVAYFLGTQRGQATLPQQSLSSPNPTAQASSPDKISLTPAEDETSNWKTHKYTDTQGFGYELKTPANWYVRAWGGGHANPEPIEIAQSFFGDNCGIGADDKISVIHFISTNPSVEVEKNSSSLKKDGFTSTTITTKDGQKVEKLTGNLTGKMDYYVYFASPKGYYQILSRQECSSELGEIFDRVISTLDMLP